MSLLDTQPWATSRPDRLNENTTPATALTSPPLDNWGALQPVMGEQIMKTGARTGTTSGKITGIEHINVDVGGQVRTFNFAYRTSGGFGCPGDSGSAVVGNDLYLLGFFSWGESIPCSQNPVAYFW